MPEKPVKRRLKLILVFRAVPNDDIELRELLAASSSDSRPTSPEAGGPSEATKQGSGWKSDETRPSLN